MGFLHPKSSVEISFQNVPWRINIEHPRSFLKSQKFQLIPKNYLNCEVKRLRLLGYTSFRWRKIKHLSDIQFGNTSYAEIILEIRLFWTIMRKYIASLTFTLYCRTSFKNSNLFVQKQINSFPFGVQRNWNPLSAFRSILNLFYCFISSFYSPIQKNSNSVN